MKLFQNISPEKSLKLVIIIYVVFALGASVQSYFQTNKKYPQYTAYNNYVIFKQSYFHLIEDKDLYCHYYDEHGDLFKYSPTFSLLFAPFANLPDIVGISLWNLLNAFVFLLAIVLLPNIDQRLKIFMLFYSLIELMTSMQNEQSNALVAGLIILGFVMLERNNIALATVLILSTVFIKLFGLVAFALYLLYPQKGKIALFTLLWGTLLFLLPLVAIDFEQLKTLYLSWFNLIQNDHSASLGISLLKILESWFNFTPNKMYIVLAGVAVFCLPLIQHKKYSLHRFRQLVLCSILIWVIIFNHKAESSTFIIAMSGVAIWFFAGERKLDDIILVVFAFVLVSLSPTDIFPKIIRREYVIPYALKALPCVIIWGKIILDMFVLKESDKNVPEKA